MLKVALRGLMAHKSRLVTTFLAVALGVAFVGGVLVLTDTVNRTFNDLFSDVFKDTDAVVRSDQEIDQGFGGGEVRGNIDEDLLAEVQDVDGVAEADVSVDGFARIIDKDGDPIGNPAMGAPTFGTNWGESDTLNPFDISEGGPPESDDELVIDQRSADNTGYEVGDTVPVQTQAGTTDYTLSGIARFGSADSPGGASFAMFTVEEAQRVLGEPGKVSSIAAAADGGVSQGELVSRIEDALGRRRRRRGHHRRRRSPRRTQDDIQQALGFLTIFLGFFGIIAVVVGAFVIYNAFAIIVAQRTREMALLRAARGPPPAGAAGGAGGGRRRGRERLGVRLHPRHRGGLRAVRLPRAAGLVAGDPAPLGDRRPRRGHPRDPGLGADPGVAGLPGPAPGGHAGRGRRHQRPVPGAPRPRGRDPGPGPCSSWSWGRWARPPGTSASGCSSCSWASCWSAPCWPGR